MSALYDDRTIFMCRTRPEDPIAEMVEAALEAADQIEPLESKEYRLNIQEGCAFAFVDPVARNLLAGKNADGTDRVVYAATKTRAQVEQMTWKERHIYESQTQIRDLPPLVTIRRPDGTSPEVHAAWCAPVPQGRMGNVIRSRDCPDGVSANDVKRHFAIFATDSTTPVPRMSCGRIVTEPYPFVTINGKREVFVTFDPNGYDASFALLVAARTSICGRVMTFAHSYRTERDVAASISRAPRVYQCVVSA